MKLSAKISTICAAAAVAFASCSGPQGWSVKGSIEGDAHGKLALEAYNAGIWYVLDSVKVDSKGNFKYQAGEPMPQVDFMRLTMPGKGSIYFPVDSIDAIEIQASAATFGTGHHLSGTTLAEAISEVDSVVASTSDFEELQRKLASIITADTTAIVAYYAVGKSVDNKPLFRADDSFGNRIYGATAMVFSQYRPEDPRANAVRQMYFEGRKALGKPVPSQEQVIEAPISGVIEIKRYDNKGVEQSLTDVTSKGNVVLLSFTNYSAQGSPAYNGTLNELYTLYKPKGFEIYQIAFDTNEAQWKESAANLPWITVWNSVTDGISALSAYNVGGFPVTYIIDRKGEIQERIVDQSQLAGKLAKYF